MGKQPLDGVRVVDLTVGPAGGRAATVLADFGAEVVSLGAQVPSLHDASRPFWGRGRVHAPVDLESPTGRGAAFGLIEGADVVIVSGRPRDLADAGVDADTLCPGRPDLVHCTITGFGPKGPYADIPDHEGVVAAKAGRMAAFDVQLGLGRPVYAAVPVATHLASQAAVQGIVAALLQRELTGLGDRVETSLLQALSVFDLVDQLGHQLAERDDAWHVPLREVSPMPTLNYHPLRTADGGWIQCGNLLEHLFMSFLDAIDLLGELLIDERFASGPAEWSPEAIEHARDLMLTRLQERTTAEWMAAFDGNGNVAAEPILTTAEAIDHRDIAVSLVDVDDPVVGACTQIGPIADLAATPGQARPRRLVDPTAEVAWHKPSSRPTAAAAASPQGANLGPLRDVTILDLSTIIAGPLGMSMLADLGARVIKVEPFGGDPFRGLLVEGRMAVKTNNGKESICIDLKSSEGRAVLHRLVADADALVHNFRGEVPAKLGIDPETLSTINPDLVWAVINGYHAGSPSSTRPATHPVIGAATGGVAYQAGDALTRDCSTLAEIREASRQIMAANEANPDPNTSCVAASAVLLALFAKRRHGGGQVVRINMQTANAWANGDDFLRYDDKPDRAPVDRDHLGLSATQRLYPTADGWVFLATATDADFVAAVEVLEAGELGADPRFATAAARAVHDVELATELAARLSRRSADAWEAAMVARGVGCVRADSIEAGAFWAADPHVVANGWAPAVDHARFGSVRRWAPLSTVGGLLDRYGPAPLAGQHTDAVLAEAGYSPAAIARLRADRIVNSEEP